MAVICPVKVAESCV
ncbi:hypothetical protein D046_4650A, partial [Vibrio parahaemolyticus V-223/04]